MSEDLIRRSDAIEAVWKPQVKPNELIFDALKTAIESEINNVPSADRPQGEWVFPYTNKRYRKCSVCGETYYAPHSNKFCGECGARMKGADNVLEGDR